MYNDVKALGDAELGLPTQCIAANKAGLGTEAPIQAKGRSQYLANVAMKINAKLGGLNVKVGLTPARAWLLLPGRAMRQAPVARRHFEITPG